MLSLMLLKVMLSLMLLKVMLSLMLLKVRVQCYLRLGFNANNGAPRPR